MPQRLTPATDGGDQGIAEPRSTVVGRTDQDREPTPIGGSLRPMVWYVARHSDLVSNHLNGLACG
jgi:hypothetical protein